jgi:large subunit ribosomal protein L30
MLVLLPNIEVFLWTKFLTVKNFIKMEKIKITLVRSVIGSTKRQKNTVVALGLGKIDSSIEQNATPEILGMVRKVQHIVKVEKI